MVKKSFILIIIILLSALLLPTEVGLIENPESPQGKNAGRPVEITEILRITDEGGKFYFKTPSRLLVASDGSIFVADDKQLLRFNEQGKFIANMQKIGEGPGEFNSLLNFQVNNDRLFVSTFQPHKMLIFDLSGKLIKEMRLKPSSGYKRVIGIFENKYYYLNCWMDFNKINSSIQELDMKLNVSTFDDQITDLKLNLPLHVISDLNTGDLYPQETFLYVLQNEHSIYVSHTSSYMIKHVDLTTGNIIGQFNRKYKRVPYAAPKSGKKSPTPKKFTPDFFQDVIGLALYRDQVWVFTSTLDREKGVLVDLFGKDGKYLDNFYLPLPRLERPDTLERRSFTIVDDFLYIVEPDNEEAPTIVKYKIEL